MNLRVFGPSSLSSGQTFSLCFINHFLRPFSCSTQSVDGYHTSIRCCRWRHSLRLCPYESSTIPCFLVEAHLSFHIEASHLSLPSPPPSIHRSMESSRGPHAGYLSDSEHLLPQLQGIGRSEGWHPSRNPLARQYDPALCGSLTQLPGRPAGRSPKGVPMRSPFSRSYVVHARADPRPFARG